MCVRAFAHRIAVVITSDILVVRTKQVHAEIIRFGRQSGRHYFGLGLAIVFVDKWRSLVETRLRAGLPTIALLFGPLHEQNLGEKLDKHTFDPAWHSVSARCAIIPVNNDHRVQNGHYIHHERENQVLRDERYDHGSGRQNFGHKQEKHNQGEQNRNTQGHLFALVRGQVEDEYAEETNEYRGYDQVNCVEEGFASDAKLVDELHAIGLLRVGLKAGHTDDVPCARGQIVLQVD